MDNIGQTLSAHNLKLDFWYNNGQLDAVCVVSREYGEVVMKRKYTVDDIAKLIFSDYLSTESEVPND